MPGMDGIAMLRRLRERGDATPVLLLTTFDDDDLPLRAAEAGAQGALLKEGATEDRNEGRGRVAAGDRLQQPGSTEAGRARYRLREEEPTVDTREEEQKENSRDERAKGMRSEERKKKRKSKR